MDISVQNHEISVLNNTKVPSKNINIGTLCWGLKSSIFEKRTYPVQKDHKNEP